MSVPANPATPTIPEPMANSTIAASSVDPKTLDDEKTFKEKTKLNDQFSHNAFILHSIRHVKLYAFQSFDIISNVIVTIAADLKHGDKKQLEDECNSCLQKINSEIDELEKDIIEVITTRSNFTLLYAKINKVLDRINNFKLREFLCPPTLTPYLQQASIPKDYEFLVTFQDSHGQDYFKVLTRVLGSLLVALGMHFDSELRKKNIVVGNEDSLSEVKSKLDKIDTRLAGEFELACNLKLSMTFFEIIKVCRRDFDKLKLKAQGIDALIQSPDIKRIQYLTQDLDPVCYFIGGYCGVDANSWLSSLETLCPDPREPRKSFECYDHLHEDELKNRYDKAIMDGFHPLQGYLTGPTFFGDKKSAEEFCVQLFTDIQNIVSKLEGTRIKIILSSTSSTSVIVGTTYTHAIGIRKLEDNKGFLIRDVNFGMFWFKDLNTLQKWFTRYINETYAKSGMFKSYSIGFLPKINLTFPKSTIYKLAKTSDVYADNIPDDLTTALNKIEIENLSAVEKGVFVTILFWRYLKVIGKMWNDRCLKSISVASKLYEVGTGEGELLSYKQYIVELERLKERFPEEYNQLQLLFKIVDLFFESGFDAVKEIICDLRKAQGAEINPYLPLLDVKNKAELKTFNSLYLWTNNFIKCLVMELSFSIVSLTQACCKDIETALITGYLMQPNQHAIFQISKITGTIQDYIWSEKTDNSFLNIIADCIREDYILPPVSDVRLSVEVKTSREQSEQKVIREAEGRKNVNGFFLHNYPILSLIRFLKLHTFPNLENISKVMFVLLCLPKYRWLKIELKQLKEALEACIQEIKRGIDDLESDLIKLVAAEFNFSQVHSKVNKIISRIANFKTNEFLFPTMAAPFVDEMRTLGQDDFTNAQSKYANDYIRVFGQALEVLVERLLLYFDSKFRTKKISFDPKHTQLQIKTELEKLDKRLAIEFDLACSLRITPSFLELFNRYRTSFESLTREAHELDSSLSSAKKEAREIDGSSNSEVSRRISYLNQSVVPFHNFSAGYSDIDANRWLSSDTDIKLFREKGKSFEQHEHLHEEDNKRQYEVRTLENTNPFHDYLTGPQLIGDKNSAEDLHRSFFKNIRSIVSDFNGTRIKILLAANLQSHVISIRKLEEDKGYLLRDLNQGIFWFKDIDTLEAWFLLYIKKSNYVEMGFFKSYALVFLPKSKIEFPQSIVYNVAKALLHRHFFRDPQESTPELKIDKESLSTVGKALLKMAYLDRWTLRLSNLMANILSQAAATDAEVESDNDKKQSAEEQLYRSIDFKEIEELRNTLPDDYRTMELLDKIFKDHDDTYSIEAAKRVYRHFKMIPNVSSNVNLRLLEITNENDFNVIKWAKTFLRAVSIVILNLQNTLSLLYANEVETRLTFQKVGISTEMPTQALLFDYSRTGQNPIPTAGTVVAVATKPNQGL